MIIFKRNQYTLDYHDRCEKKIFKILNIIRIPCTPCIHAGGPGGQGPPGGVSLGAKPLGMFEI